jgi:hypothetical protein
VGAIKRGFIFLGAYVRIAKKVKKSPGGWSEVVPPVPIPNTEVKRFSADDTEDASPCGKYVTARRL